MKTIYNSAIAALVLVASVSCQGTLEPAYLELNTETLEMPCDGGSTAIGVKSNRDWTASSDQDWVSLTPSSAEAFEASSYMILTVQPNIDLPRTAIITVSSDNGDVSATMTVTQGEDGLIIKTADQFVAAMQALSNPETADNYKLGRDIDLSGKTLPVIESLMNPFDGQGHTISNWTTSSALFKHISSIGSVKNLVLDASCHLTITGEETNFGFIANTAEGTIENVTNNADITVLAMSKGYKGAICGESKAPITNCVNTGKITFEGDIHTDGSSYFGGVIGRMAKEGMALSNSRNEGDITFKFNGTLTQSMYMAGVTGAVNSNSKALNCTNSGKVSLHIHGSNTNVHAAGVVCYAGGEVADCSNSGDITLRAESAEGKADGGVKGTGVAGVACYIGWSGNTVKNNTNSGNITLAAGYTIGYQQVGSATKFSSNVGGVFGHAYKTSIVDCHNTGSVSSGFSAIDKCPTAGYNTTARQSAAGVVASGWGLIENCSNKGALNIEWITSTHNASLAKNFVTMAGGITGGDYHSDQVSTVVKNCSNEGNIFYTCDAAGSNNAVGGISGWPTKENASGKSIENCTNSGNIIIDGYSKSRVGGISGGAATHKNNINRGKIELKGGASTCAIGGIAGFMNFLNIENCENNGDVTSAVKLSAAQSSAGSAAGGLVGAVGNTAMTYTNCKINCTVNAPTGSNMAMLVGAIGHDKANAKTFALGTADKPLMVKGKLGTTILTEANYESTLKAANYTGVNKGITFNVKYLK